MAGEGDAGRTRLLSAPRWVKVSPLLDDGCHENGFMPGQGVFLLLLSLLFSASTHPDT